MAKTEFKNVARHVQDLANGRMLGVGEVVTLSDVEQKVAHNAALIARGILLPTDRGAKRAASHQTEDKEGVS